MSDEAEITGKFWKALWSDRTVMLGLIGDEEGRVQPMTAVMESEQHTGPIWFFVARSAELAKAVGDGKRAVLHFAAMRHDVFATVRGTLAPDDEPVTIDRLWDPLVASWFEGGRDDPELLLLRFDPEQAQIWLNENSLFSEIRLLLGRDPKTGQNEKVTEVELAG